jgi:hypothetical protein
LNEIRKYRGEDTLDAVQFFKTDERKDGSDEDGPVASESSFE